MILLTMDTSSRYCYASISESGKNIKSFLREIPKERDDWVSVFFNELLCGQNASVDALALGSGPGSFTGLRLSFSYFKTWSLLKGLPLYIVSSAYLWRGILEIPDNGILLNQVNKNMYYAFGADCKMIALSADELFFGENKKIKPENIYFNNQEFSKASSGEKIKKLWPAAHIVQVPKETSFAPKESFLVISDFQNAVPEYGHALNIKKKNWR